MKIRMKIAIAGSVQGHRDVRGGDVIDVPDAAGARYCKLGYAEPVADPDAGVERAVVEDDSEKRTLTTDKAPVKRSGRPKLPRDSDGNIIRDDDSTAD